MPDFRPVARGEKHRDIPLFGRPEFKGGILESDQVSTREAVMSENIETKEIRSAPTSERKDEEVKSGVYRQPARQLCGDSQCEHADVSHFHDAGSR